MLFVTKYQSQLAQARTRLPWKWHCLSILLYASHNYTKVNAGQCGVSVSKLNNHRENEVAECQQSHTRKFGNTLSSWVWQ